MTTSDRKKTQILVALLTIAGFTWLFAFHTRGTETTQSKRKSKPDIEARHLKETRIQIAGIHEAFLYDSRKNIFQYGSTPVSKPTGTIVPNLVSSESNTRTATAERPSPVEPPPSKTFKYEGFSIRGTTSNGRVLASLSDGGVTYSVTLNECLMAQYCVRQITESMVEIEDLQNKQRRTLPKNLQ